MLLSKCGVFEVVVDGVGARTVGVVGSYVEWHPTTIGRSKQRILHVSSQVSRTAVLMELYSIVKHERQRHSTSQLVMPHVARTVSCQTSEVYTKVSQ